MYSLLRGSEVGNWVQHVVEKRGKQGLYAEVLLCLTSLSGLFSGFCMGFCFCFFFFFADLVWFLNRLVYIFSANSVNGRKQKNNARRDKSAVFMGNKEFFPDGCAF